MRLCLAGTFPFWLTSAGLFVGTFLAVELGNLMISKTALAKVV